ncbi:MULTISPECIES: gas vesicle protein GvpG [Streptomyces]|uniref:Gas vesicle synthesis protein n=1 Tax=Streptomyces viridosporus (strain ATCC 14672 / DSM 40746 / JCM 4963 / KCTC 9882 / NRRL B-12104 / FH 1290) TaxID=566461 RepID=D5ZQJ2_STRV1|nr:MULTISPECIES: gas vesicle protein GvpG [Streptomyces]EFE66407.1 gas vesicle synthesis protein [Streptomyces viridosporus ATCC 14672]PWJ05892.1 gas vesicle protein [Streptomyces sp. NWU49]
MGIVSGLLLLPLAPVRGTAWIADHLLQEARRQFYDPRAVQARLSALNRALDEGDIDEAAFEREEERLLALLEHPARRPAGHTTATAPAALMAPAKRKRRRV